jgi:hypothetical protein
MMASEAAQKLDQGGGTAAGCAITQLAPTICLGAPMLGFAGACACGGWR